VEVSAFPCAFDIEASVDPPQIEEAGMNQALPGSLFSLVSHGRNVVLIGGLRPELNSAIL
jgi:hypothetical protein